MMTEYEQDWPLRGWALGGLGATIGLSLHWIVETAREIDDQTPWRLALAALLVTGGLAFAYTLERGRIASSAAFAALAGVIVGSTFYWNGTGLNWSGGEPWRIICALLTVAIAAPLFAAWRADGMRRALPPYAAAHNRAWTNVVLWGASWGFALVVWLLAWLLAELFGLIGLSWLRHLLGKSWFALMLIGGAVGAGIGLLRDREAILGTLQRVATTVLGVLAPVLATGLLLFLVSIPFTGLSPLWQATRNTTPILIACVIGALILANAVLRDAPEEEPRTRVLHWGAIGLGVAILPLGVIAAISTGLRIAQYGLTPDRLWAVVFGGIAVAYGIAYLVALARGRMDWSTHVRPANLRLGLGLCALAFLLSTPLLSFGALSTRDQIARLNDGRTPADKFDWRALRWDFGPAGKAAVAELAKSGATPAVRRAAGDALASDNRSDVAMPKADETPIEQRLTILPKSVPIPDDLRRVVAQSGPCEGAKTRCVLFYSPGANEAVVANSRWSKVLSLGKDGWSDGTNAARTSGSSGRVNDAELAKGPVAIRPITRRQIFVGDKPVGEPFE